MSDKDLLKDAREAFDRASEAEAKNRRNWLDDVRFARLGEQWPENVKRQRELDGRPCLTINRLPSFIRQVTNDARQNKPSIKFHPVGDGADQETAEILNGLTRNIEYSSNADVAYDTALDHAVTGGFGYFRINTDYASDDSFDQDILIERIANPLTVYGDPASTAADSADWDEAFITELWTKAAFKKKYPGADISNFETDEKDLMSWQENDQIRVAEWWKRTEVPSTLIKVSNGVDEMVLLEDSYLKELQLFDVQGYKITGTRETMVKKVSQRIINGCEILDTTKWAGKYIPIVPVYGDEVMVEGERHWLSLVRFAKDPQRMVNYWRTTSTELVALQPKAPWVGPKGAFDSDPVKWASANTVNHQYLEYDGPTPPQRQPFAGMPAGAIQEAMNANDDMKSIMGIFDASLGAKSNETSGRAIMARQREGDVSTFNYIDNLSRAIRHAGRILVDLIPRVYSAPRMIRVIHEDGSNKTVPINQEFNPQMEQQQEEGPQEELQEVTRLYDLTTGKYDVTCEVGPSFNTKREEAANQMTEFMRAVPGVAPLIGDLIAKNLDWPGADEMAKRLRSALPPNLQGPNPQAQAMQQQMQQMDMHAKEAVGQLQGQVQELTQKLQAMEADKQIEMGKLAIDKQNADTNRVKAINDQTKTQADIMREQAQAMQPKEDTTAPVMGAINQLMTSLQELHEYNAAPSEVVRDPAGRAVAIRKGKATRQIARGPDGRPTGVQ
jgi:hypothetical protein